MKQDAFSKYLKGLVIAMAVLGMLLCVFFVPGFGKDIVKVNPALTYLYYPSLGFVYFTAIPVYIVLWNAWRIFCNIGKNNSFCFENSTRLKNIAYLASADTLLYVAAAIALLSMDALGWNALIFIVIIVFIGFAMAIVCSSLSHLVDKAATLKEENDLTI
jgi:hypothetical protein